MKRIHVQHAGHEPEHDTTDDDTNNSTILNPEITNNTTLHHPPTLSAPPHLLSPRQYHIHQHPQYSQNIPTFTVPTTETSSEDGGKIVKSRRTGRPPGAKNKPKPEQKPAISPYFLEIQSGSDLVASLTRFTRDRGIGICVLSATGAVSNVTLKRPTGNCTYGTMAFPGNFYILSLSACVINGTMAFMVSGGGSGPTIVMSGPNGSVVGGKVVGPLICAGTVYVVATWFNSPSYVSLPVLEGGGTHVSLHGGVSEVLCAPTPLTVRSPQPPY